MKLPLHLPLKEPEIATWAKGLLFIHSKRIAMPGSINQPTSGRVTVAKLWNHSFSSWLCRNHYDEPTTKVAQWDAITWKPAPLPSKVPWVRHKRNTPKYFPSSASLNGVLRSVKWSSVHSPKLSALHFQSHVPCSCIFCDLFVGLCKLWEHSSLKQCQGDLQVTVEDAKGLCEGWGVACGLEWSPLPSKLLLKTSI